LIYLFWFKAGKGSNSPIVSDRAEQGSNYNESDYHEDTIGTRSDNSMKTAKSKYSYQ